MALRLGMQTMLSEKNAPHGGCRPSSILSRKMQAFRGPESPVPRVGGRALEGLCRPGKGCLGCGASETLSEPFFWSRAVGLVVNN